jgi:hypothetical protein
MRFGEFYVLSSHSTARKADDEAGDVERYM